ncbi:hypothetical protein [Nocardioides solisilvae]|uniref:hypothetical protein n=1 Tax=Nocardioides solisilvae TaxID=1542435 RepID=UPI000D740F7B|nr:hypothetical protein [Nocardioides solisilvae]
MRRTTACSTVLLLGTALLTTAGSATGSTGETCRGLPVTIHSSARNVQGTEGDDVVLVEYSGDDGNVRTYGGDDVVCLRGDDPGYSLPDSIARFIDVGDGDDVVDGSQAPTLNLSVTLGAGSDTFVGGPVWNEVVAGSWGEDHADTEVDVLVGGARRDWFTSGTHGEANGDRVVLGAGDDRVNLAGYWADGGLLRGAGGEDTLSLEPTSDSLVLDAKAGTYSEDGRTAAVLEGFERFVVDARDHPGTLAFRGSAADESLYGVGLTVTARMGDGDDWASLFWVGDGSVVDGGRGRDGYYTELYGPDRVALDLRSGDLRVSGGETPYRRAGDRLRGRHGGCGAGPARGDRRSEPPLRHLLRVRREGVGPRGRRPARCREGPRVLRHRLPGDLLRRAGGRRAQGRQRA